MYHLSSSFAFPLESVERDTTGELSLLVLEDSGLGWGRHTGDSNTHWSASKGGRCLKQTVKVALLGQFRNLLLCAVCQWGKMWTMSSISGLPTVFRNYNGVSDIFCLDMPVPERPCLQSQGYKKSIQARKFETLTCKHLFNQNGKGNVLSSVGPLKASLPSVGHSWQVWTGRCPVEWPSCKGNYNACSK